MDQGHKDHTFAFVILVYGDIGVAPVFHHIEAVSDKHVVGSDLLTYEIHLAHARYLILECRLMIRVMMPNATPLSSSTLRTWKLTVSWILGISLVR